MRYFLLGQCLIGPEVRAAGYKVSAPADAFVPPVFDHISPKKESPIWFLQNCSGINNARPCDSLSVPPRAFSTSAPR